MGKSGSPVKTQRKAAANEHPAANVLKGVSSAAKKMPAKSAAKAAVKSAPMKKTAAKAIAKGSSGGKSKSLGLVK